MFGFRVYLNWNVVDNENDNDNDNELPTAKGFPAVVDTVEQKDRSGGDQRAG